MRLAARGRDSRGAEGLRQEQNGPEFKKQGIVPLVRIYGDPAGFFVKSLPAGAAISGIDEILHFQRTRDCLWAR